MKQKLRVTSLLLVCCLALTCLALTACGYQAQPETNVITVRFMVDETEYAKVTGKVGEIVKAPETNPTKEGYTFLKWEGFTEGATFTANADYSAVFEEAIPPVQEDITVRFMVGETEYAKVTGKAGETITAPETNPTKEGYTFVNWEGFTEGATFTADADYQAVFEPVTPPAQEDITVRFMVGETEYAKVVGKEGETITAPETNPTKEGYTFVKWDGFTEGATFTADRDYEAVFEPVTPPAKDVTVRFMVGETEYAKVVGKEGETITAPETNPTKEGYRFVKWDGFTEGAKFATDATYNAVFVQEVKTAPVAYVENATFDKDSLTKDAMFNNTTAINTFDRVQKPDNANDSGFGDTYNLYLVHDNTYLYVYIESFDSVNDNGDRLGFYYGKKGADKSAYIETYPNDNGKISKGADLCEAIKVGKENGIYVLKVKIALSDVEIDKDGKIGFSVRFVNHAEEGGTHFVYINDGATHTGTKVEDPAKLAKLTLADYVAPAPVTPAIDASSVAYVENATFADNLTKDAMFDNAANVTKFTRVQGDTDYSYTVNLVHDNTYLYVYIFSADTAMDNADRLGFYYGKKGATASAYIETFPNDNGKISKGAGLYDAIKVGKVEGGYALKVKIALSDVEIDKDGKIGFSVRFVNNNNADIHITDGATHSGTKVEDPTKLAKLTLVDYKAPAPVTPVIDASSVAYVENATFADNLTKDVMFDNAANVTKFTRVQGDTDYSYTVNLVHDNTYLYVYIFSADTAMDNADRLGFYYGKKGATASAYIETFPNDNGRISKGAGLYDAIKVGKVEGGYALKVKIALSDVEIDENGKIGFSVRFVNNSNADIHITDGATHSGTKVEDPTKLAKLTLVGYKATKSE